MEAIKKVLPEKSKISNDELPQNTCQCTSDKQISRPGSWRIQASLKRQKKKKKALNR